MPLFLVVGDPHLTEPEIYEGQQLLDWIWLLTRQHCPDLVIFLGDLFHTHAIIHADVQEFWRWNLVRLATNAQITDKQPQIIVLEGNHDRPLSRRFENSSALNAFKSIPNVHVVTEPQELFGCNFMPYFHSEAEFLSKISKLTYKPLFCHQTFNGAQYENGMYAKDGWDASKVPAPFIISGHIHSRMEFGNVIYPGSPRWRTLADANHDKAIDLIEIEDDKMVDREAFPTDVVCSPIYKFEDTPTSPLSISPVPNARYNIAIKGPADWIETRKGLYPYAKVSTFPTSKQIQVKESDGIQVAFDKYMADFTPKYRTSLEKLKLKISDVWQGR